MPKCRCGGIGRRPGLKIPWENIPYRFDPGHRHQFHIAEWSNPVARRAHNPKVVGSNPASATKKNKHPIGCLFFLVADFVGQVLNLPPTARDRLPLAASRANNLQTSENTSVKCFREGLTAQSAVERAESSAWREETPRRLLRAVVGSNSCALSKNIVAPSGKAQLHPRCSLFLNFAQKTVRRTVFLSLAPQPKRTSTHSGACFFLLADFVGQGLNLPPTARDRPPFIAYPLPKVNFCVIIILSS